jgi:MFS family permease
VVLLLFTVFGQNTWYVSSTILRRLCSIKRTDGFPLVNYAAVMGLYEDANISTSQFSNLALFFYVSYLALEFPHGYGMQRLPTAKYLGAAVILWGLVTALTCVCKNYGALVATRVLLGCFESAVAPSLILITSMWYKKNEQPLRTGKLHVYEMHVKAYTDFVFSRHLVSRCRDRNNDRKLDQFRVPALRQ